MLFLWMMLVSVIVAGGVVLLVVWAGQRVAGEVRHTPVGSYFLMAEARTLTGSLRRRTLGGRSSLPGLLHQHGPRA